MDKVCKANEVRECDRKATELYNIPSVILMENAAAGVVRAVENKFSVRDLKVAIFCGKGNNGGDGLAVARLLSIKGAKVFIYTVPEASYRGDALINYQICEHMDLPMADASGDTDISDFDVVIDAIFGTGLRDEINGEIKEIIENINSHSKYVVSVDIPSGVSADTGEILNVCVNADETVTFAAYKRAMFLFPGCEACGKVTLCDISMPRELLENVGAFLTDSEFIDDVIGTRDKNTHKGDYGKLLIIGGSKGMTGAPCMAAEAALRSGAGLITVGVCECLNDIFEMKLTEPMTLPLSCRDGHLDFSAYPKIKEQLLKSTAVIFGPGLGRSEDIGKILEQILKDSTVPVIIDADGINVLDKSYLSECNCPVILTPHTVELSRLSGYSAEYIENNRFSVSQEISSELGATVILKGYHTIVTGANGVQYINNTGNPGMATGGSGDVLAGMVGALVSRGIREDIASAAAVYLHGLAGDIAKDNLCEESLTPTDLINSIGAAIDSCLK